MSFFAEIRRRKVFQVTAVYAVVAWLIVQVVATVEAPLSLPEWFATVVILLLALGFPIVLIFSWAYEITSEGVRATANVQRPEVSVSGSDQRLNYITHGLVLLAVGFLVVDQYVLQPQRDTSGSDRAALSVAVGSASRIRRHVTSLGSTQAIGNSGLATQLAISRDGRRIAYVIRPGDRRFSQLYVRQLDELEAQPLANTAGAENPFISPDGQWVAYFTDGTDEQLRKIAFRGSPPVPIVDTQGAAGGYWREDDTVVFPFNTYDSRPLVEVPAAGGVPLPISAPEPHTGHGWPSPLPGGRAVVFSVRPGSEVNGLGSAAEGHIAALSFETGETRTLVERAYRPQYAPTGHLVFARSGSLWAAPFDVERLEITGREVPLIEGVQQNGFFGTAAYALADDGTLVYVPGPDVQSGLGYRNLVWVDRNGIEKVIDVPPHRYQSMALSPDGTHLSVEIDGGGNEDIWNIDLDRDISTRLTFDPARDSKPVWARDGERVAFASERGDGGIYWLVADGTGLPQPLLTGQPTARPSSFFPSGERLLLEAITPTRDIDLHSLAPLGDNIPEPFLEFEGRQEMASISPNGRWIAYQSDESGTSEIYVRPFPNINDGKLTVSRGGGTFPLWAPNSNELFYRTAETIMVVLFETASGSSAPAPRLLFSTGNYVYAPDTYEISSDGQRFLMQKDTVQSELAAENTQLIIVEHWFDELQRLVPTGR